MIMKRANVTMKDIARELGVSVATVSRALKDSPRIAAEKREEIKRYRCHSTTIYALLFFVYISRD